MLRCSQMIHSHQRVLANSHKAKQAMLQLIKEVLDQLVNERRYFLGSLTTSVN